MGEANIQINGKTLTLGQAMALRMAVSGAYGRPLGAKSPKLQIA